MITIKDRSLYLVITQAYCLGRGALDVARQAILGGVDIIQMREKDKSVQELTGIGRELSDLCRRNGVKFIVNDDPDLAMSVGADGVHLGQEDMRRFSLDKARRMLGRDKIIGVSTHSLEEFKIANSSDVDYIAFGPIFETMTKDYFLGTKDIKEILSILGSDLNNQQNIKKVFFIGGINLTNLGELLDMGVRNIALIRAITEADDITSGARGFKERLNYFGAAV